MRALLNRRTIPVPTRHRDCAMLFSQPSAPGLPPFAWDFWQLGMAATVLGILPTMSPTVLFEDRMIQLREDVEDPDPAHESWLRS